MSRNRSRRVLFRRAQLGLTSLKSNAATKPSMWQRTSLLSQLSLLIWSAQLSKEASKEASKLKMESATHAVGQSSDLATEFVSTSQRTIGLANSEQTIFATLRFFTF